MIPTRLLPQAITWETATVGPRGTTYANPVTVPARVQFANTLVRDAAGAEVISSARVYLQPAAGPKIGDRVTLPNGVQRLVIARAENVGARRVELVTVDVK